MIKLNKVFLQLLISANFVFAAAYAEPAMLHLEQVATLPHELKETSALTYYRGLLWTVVDSDSTTIFGINPKTGRIDKQVSITNAKPRDWEAITQDKNAIYVGDVGNNRGDRGFVVIYRVDKSAMRCLDHADSCQVASQPFTAYFPKFKPAKIHYLHPYDIEAMTIHDSTITLYNKNWTDRTKTLRYVFSIKDNNPALEQLPAIPIPMIATDVSKYDDQLWILGYQLDEHGKQPYLTQFKQRKGKFDLINTWKLDLHAQIEGLAVVSEKEIYFTCEKDKTHKAALFKASAI